MINSDSNPSIEKDIAKVLKVDFEYVNVFGVYDAVLKVRDENVKELADKIRAIPKIHSVMVLTCV
jgi:hypothetical protein